MGDHRLPASVSQTILERAGGIPLFVEELAKTVLEAAGDRSDADAFAALTIPATLHNSLMARLDQLGPVKELAQIGSVIGREFSPAMLQAIAPHHPDIEGGLHRLRDSGLADEARAGWCPRDHLPPCSRAGHRLQVAPQEASARAPPRCRRGDAGPATGLRGYRARSDRSSLLEGRTLRAGGGSLACGRSPCSRPSCSAPGPRPPPRRARRSQGGAAIARRVPRPSSPSKWPSLPPAWPSMAGPRRRLRRHVRAPMNWQLSLTMPRVCLAPLGGCGHIISCAAKWIWRSRRRDRSMRWQRPKARR